MVYHLLAVELWCAVFIGNVSTVDDYANEVSAVENLGLKKYEVFSLSYTC